MMLRSLIAGFAVMTLAVTPWHATRAQEHAHKGPHKGDLVELGAEDYHAEFVHDEKAGSVTVYLLGPDAKTEVATEAKEIAVNAKVGGKGVQMKIKPAPQKTDKSGMSSRFMSKSKELIDLLEDHDAKLTLSVVIAGKPFNGKIEYEHEDEKPAAKK